MRHRTKILMGFIVLCVMSLFVFSASTQQAQSGQPGQKTQAQAPQQTQPITVHNVKGNIYQVKGGSGANAAFFIGEMEVVAIDAKMTEESAKQMVAEIGKLTSLPIKSVLITHSDGDHVNGFTGFPKGLTIIAHEETRRYMDEAFKEENLRVYLPNITFSNRLTLYLGPKKIELLNLGPAHTSGDAVIFFPEDKVAVLGDLMFIGRDPLIHRHKNGSYKGAISALKAILGLDADTFLHGHGDVASRADVEAAIKFLEEKEAKVKALIAEGKSLDEIKKIFNVEDRPAQAGRPRWISLPEVIYLELTEKK